MLPTTLTPAARMNVPQADALIERAGVPALEGQPLTAADLAGLQIVGFDLPEAQEHRLRTMGLFEGQCVQLLKKSNPVIIKVAGARMALAREIAECVYVSADK